MRICEAVKKALDEKKCIKREIAKGVWDFIKIKPTKNTACILIDERACRQEKNSRVPLWNPKAEDLISSDWVLCD